MKKLAEKNAMFKDNSNFCQFFYIKLHSYRTYVCFLNPMFYCV